MTVKLQRFSVKIQNVHCDTCVRFFVLKAIECDVETDFDTQNRHEALTLVSADNDLTADAKYQLTLK